MATRRQLRADRDAAEQRATEAEQRTRALTAELAVAHNSLALAKERGDRMAGRIIGLSRQLKAAQQRPEEAAR